MNMQITAVPIGGMVSPPVEFQEKRPPLPIEKKGSSEEKEAALQDKGNAPAPEIKQTTSDLEQISLAFNRRLKFVVDRDSKEIIIKVIDNETDKVIKVLPPEELQRLHSRIKETIGFLFDVRV